MIVAIVPAKDRADPVGATVRALLSVDHVDRVLVVDDGSVDATADEDRAAGADVRRLPVNPGKSGAVAAGMEACPDADVLLLVDADVGDRASTAACLLAPVLAGDADLVVGVMPARDGRAASARSSCWPAPASGGREATRSRRPCAASAPCAPRTCARSTRPAGSGSRWR